MTLETGRIESHRTPRRDNPSQENLRYCTYEVNTYHNVSHDLAGGFKPMAKQLLTVVVYGYRAKSKAEFINRA